MQLRRDVVSRIRYPDALPSLLDLMNEQSSTKFDPDPLFIESLTDERLFENPILYINCDELPNFEFSVEENEALRRYMELGGFVYLDAGIKASFLGSDLGHSYAAWEERDEVREWFGQIFPEKSFTPLARNHEIFRTFYKGLPDNEYLRLEEDQKRLPDTAYFVEQENTTGYLFSRWDKSGSIGLPAPFVLWGGAGMSSGLGFLPSFGYRVY